MLLLVLLIAAVVVICVLAAWAFPNLKEETTRTVRTPRRRE
jgi:hypothetical protein